MEGKQKFVVVSQDDMGMLVRAALLVKMCHDEGTLTGDIIDLLGAVLFTTLDNSVPEPD